MLSIFHVCPFFYATLLFWGEKKYPASYRAILCLSSERPASRSQSKAICTDLQTRQRAGCFLRGHLSLPQLICCGILFFLNYNKLWDTNVGEAWQSLHPLPLFKALQGKPASSSCPPWGSLWDSRPGQSSFPILWCYLSGSLVLGRARCFSATYQPCVAHREYLR